MALVARNIRQVIPGQCPTGGTVIKAAVRPFRDRVTGGAHRCGIRESGRDVVWHGAADRRRTVPGRRMAAHAVRGVQRVIVVRMARGARRRSGRRMCTRQSESGHAMVKRGCIPSLGRVAVRTIRCGKNRTGGCMCGIVRLLPQGQMAVRVSARSR